MPWADDRDCALLEKKVLATGIKRHEWWPPSYGRHEVTFAVNLKTLSLCEYTGSRDGADAWKKRFGPAWLTGTIDWEGRLPYEGTPWIDDLKTGRWPVHPDSKQLLSYGLYPWLKAERSKSWGCARSITQWPKYPIAALPIRTWGTPMCGLDMEEHVDDLRYSLEHPTETNPTEEGCRFCDCRPVCPAHSEGM